MTNEKFEPIRSRIMREAYELADRGDFDGYNAIKVMCDEVQKLLKIAMVAKQPEQAPVAWQWLDTAHFRKKIPNHAISPEHWRPLYTEPQSAQKPTNRPIAKESPSFACSLAAIDEYDPQSFIHGALWQAQQTAQHAQPEQKPLTGERITHIVGNVADIGLAMSIARAIEAAHNIK